MSEEILLEANELSRSFNGKKIIDGVSISLRAGEVLGLLGPNGAGKTTTLKMIAGVLAPDSGNVIVCGEDMIDKSFRAKKHIGYLPEEAPLYSDLTVDEYLDYCAGLRQVVPADRDSAVQSAKHLCDLGDVGKRLVSNLSKGYKQRIGLAQAIIHKPSLLILDEPTNGLDPNQIRDVRSLVRSLAASSQALIISTHVLSEVQALCDRVVILHHGQVAYDERLSDQNKFLHVCFATTPENTFFDQLTGVIDATTSGQNNFLLSVTDHEAAAAALVQRCASTNTVMLEMSTRQNQLEQLFFDITCNDPTVLP